MAEQSKDEDARSICKDQRADPIQTGFTDTAEVGAKELKLKEEKLLLKKGRCWKEKAKLV